MISYKTFDEIILSSNAKSKINAIYIMRQKTMLFGILLATFAAATLLPLAAAQVYEQPSNTMTVEQMLEKARERVQIVKEHPGQGSGTPYLDANGVIGASIISAAVFGGIFVTFIVRARQIEKRLAAKRMLQ
jgi:hypothetical protein